MRCFLNNKKKIRKLFRESVFKRDKFTCQICGQAYISEQSSPSLGFINAHHIIDRNEMPSGGYCKENGITVCDKNGKFPGEISCHMLVEQWHITGGDESKVSKEYRPKSLYKKIGSSYELALERSKKL
jgi:hypothetical protein